MKKIFLLLVTAIALNSCTEDIRDSNHTLEGLKNGSRWRAPGTIATLGANSLVISGGNQFETLTINLLSPNPSTYQFGVSEYRKATFTVTNDSGTKVYATGTGIGNGEVTIEEYDEVKHTLTGVFRFNAIAEDAVDPANPTAAETINFIEGHFYQIPVYPAQ